MTVNADSLARTILAGRAQPSLARDGRSNEILHNINRQVGHLRRVQQLTDLIGWTIGTAYVRRYIRLRGVSPAGKRCHFVLPDEDQS